MKYLSGETVKEGDIVKVMMTSRWTQARVAAVLVPGSSEATEWNAPLGGAMVESEEMGWVLWPAADADIEFVRRPS